MCCISLACNVHRDTLRIVNSCSDKLQRGRCAKNTVRFLKNDQYLTCPQCAVRTVRSKAVISSEKPSCDSEGNFIAAVRSECELDKEWAQEDVILPFLISQVQIPCSVPACARSASTQLEFHHPNQLQISDDNLGELSYEDGISLIDEMYGPEHLNQGVEEMDTSVDEMYFVHAETQYDLEQAHNVIAEINKIVRNGHKDVTSDGSVFLPQKHGACLAEVHETTQVGIKANIFETRQVLDRARHELDKLWQAQQVMESDLVWCLGKG